MLLATPGTAGAEEPTAPWQQGPSLRETGRMAAPQLPVPSAGIPVPAAAVPDTRERAVEPAAVAAEIAADRTGTIDPRVLTAELDARLATLVPCLEDKQRLTVRFRIERAGNVNEIEIVDGSRIAPGVLGCVKTRMGLWTFTRPSGGTVAIERDVSTYR